MSTSFITESDVEQVALDWLANLGWKVSHGPDIAPDTPGASGPITAKWCWRNGCMIPWRQWVRLPLKGVSVVGKGRTWD